ncbi:transcriptional regulator with XRE-family HTH domain [Nitrobacteraceae bacterium AZCC 1564]
MQTRHGCHVRRLRRLLGIKQDHLAALMKVAQTTVSRWESGALRMTEDQYEAALNALSAPSPGSDRAVRRLVEGSSLRVHLICDRTHRLLAASHARCAEWRMALHDVMGRSLLGYASPEILAAEEGLRENDGMRGRLAPCMSRRARIIGWMCQLHPALCFGNGSGLPTEAPSGS